MKKAYTDGKKKKYMKRCSTSYVTEEMQIKSTVSYHYMPHGIIQPKSITVTTNAGKDMDRNSHSLLMRM